MTTFFDTIGWSPHIGDPSIGGWLTVLAYAVCCYQSHRVFRSSERIFEAPIPRQRWLWACIAGGMLLLGINKQLDLQTFFTATARYLAWQQGWYDSRYLLQKAFILCIAVGGLTTMLMMFITFRRVWRWHLYAILGTCTLLVFVMVRASSFHNVDLFLGSRFLGLKMNWLLELSGIGLVLYNARLLLRKRRPLIDIAQLANETPASETTRTQPSNEKPARHD